jgi:hypothetical protein
MRTILTAIMGLTKINYNACNYGDGVPVTVRFADKVGDVLTMGLRKKCGKAAAQVLRVGSSSHANGPK